MRNQLRHLALLLALVSATFPAVAQEPGSASALELSEALSDALDTVIVASAAGSWDAVTAGVGAEAAPTTGRATFEAARQLRDFAGLIDRTYAGLDRGAALQRAVSEKDVAALERIAHDMAFDGIRLQVSANVKDRMADREAVLRRMQVILDLYQRQLAGLVAEQAEATGGVGLHRKSNIEYYLEQLQSERILGGDPATSNRRPSPSEFGQVGLWMLEELSKTLAWERPVGAPVEGRNVVEPELALSFIRVAEAVRGASDAGQWTELADGWQAFAAEGAAGEADLDSPREVGRAIHAACAQLAELSKSDHRRLLALGLAAAETEKVAVAMQALAYENIRLQLMSNLDARLQPVEVSRARLAAARSVYETFFAGRIDTALTREAESETAVQVRDGLAALEIPNEPKRVHVVQFGRDIVPVLGGLVRLLDHDLGENFAGSMAATTGLPENADEATRELFRQGEAAFARGDYEAAGDAFRGVARSLPGFKEVQGRLAETYRLLADSVGRPQDAAPLLETPTAFVEMLGALRAAAASEAWDSLAEGWSAARDPVASRPEGAAGRAFDLRNVTAAVLAATGRNRAPQVARALQARNTTDLDRMLRVVAFDVVREQISQIVRSRLEPEAEARRRQAFARELARWLLGSVARGQDAPEEIVRTNAGAAWDRLVDSDLVATPTEFEDDPTRLARIRRYAQLGLTAVERLLAALRPTLSAAQLQESDGSSRLPLGAELGDFTETASAVLEAARRGLWAELRLGFAARGAPLSPEGPGADAPPEELARRLALHHEQSKRAFEIDRSRLFDAAFEAQDTRLLQRATVTLAFDQLRILVTRNLRARLDPRPDSLRRVEEARAVYETLMRPFLVPEGSSPNLMTLDQTIRSKLAQMASPEVLGQPSELVGLEGTSQPDIGAFGDLSTDVFGAAAQLLVRATQGDQGTPDLREDDPEAFLELVAEVRRAVRDENWEGLRAGFAGRTEDAAAALQPAAFQLGLRLAQRAREIEKEINKSTTMELERALVTRSLADIERMLALLAYDTCRMKISRNIGNRLIDSAASSKRGLAVRRIFETELASLVDSVVGLGEDAGSRRTERIRRHLAGMEEIEAQIVGSEEVTPQMVSDYGTHALEAVGEMSAAMKLVDPGAIAMRREGKTARTQFRSDDPGALLALLTGIREAMKAGEWAELRAGFNGRSRDGTASLGYRLLDRCRVIDEIYKETRVELVSRLLEIEQPSRLERVLTVIAFDTIRVKVLKNAIDGLRPADVARSRTQAIRSIVETELIDTLTRDEGDSTALEPEPTGEERVSVVMEILDEMSSPAVMKDELDPEGGMAPEGDTSAYRSSSLRLLKLLSGSIGRLPAVVSEPAAAARFREQDPAEFLAMLDAVRDSGAEGNWAALREGFEAGGEGSELDLPGVLAGRQLRSRADDVDARFSQPQVEAFRSALEGENEFELERQLLELAFNELRLKVSRNARDLLTPYAIARSRCEAMTGIYEAVFQPLLDDALGREASAALGEQFAGLADTDYLGTNPEATEGTPSLPDPGMWGRAAALALTRLNEGLRQVRFTDPSAGAAGPAAATPERMAELREKYDSGSNDVYVTWAVDGLRVAIELEQWGLVLRGLQEGGLAVEGDPEAMTTGRVLRRAAQDIRRLFGTDHYPDLERAIIEQDRRLLNRLMILMAYDIVRVRLNDNLSTDLQPLEKVRDRHAAVRTLYYSVLRAAVLGESKEDMAIGRRMDQVVERALGQLDRPTVIGPRAVDKDAYRESARHVLQTLVRAISDPEKVVEGMEGGEEEDR